MATNTTIFIIVAAVVAILLIAGLTWVARNRRNQQRQVEAGKIRENARQETLLVKQREALAEETAAKARAAQAEADAKAAQASGLQQQAAAHRDEAVTSRDHLNEQWDRADKLDPASRAASDTPAPAHDEPHPTGGSQ